MKNNKKQIASEIDQIFENTEKKCSHLFSSKLSNKRDLEYLCTDFMIQTIRSVEDILIKNCDTPLSNYYISEVINDCINRSIILIDANDSQLAKFSVDNIIFIVKAGFRTSQDRILYHNKMNQNRPFLMIITDYFLESINKLFRV